MKYLTFLGVVVFGTAIISIWSQSSQSRLSDEGDEKAESSEVVLVGKVISMYLIVRKEKLIVGDPEKWTFPDTKDYLLATEVEMEISALFKADKEAPKRKTIRILIPGYAYPRHNVPIFMIGKKHLVFLNKAKLEEDKYKGAIVLRSKTGFISPENDFDPSDYFMVNFGEYGVIKDEKKISEFTQHHRKLP